MSAEGSAVAVRFEGVSRRFGDQVAVADVSLDIREGEFFALLGPSGCGKTTLLRLLAGFDVLDTGRVLLDDADLAGIPPHRRAVNMMFQSYALFPHLNVAANIAFGLRMQGLAKADIAVRVEEMLALVKLEGLGRRRPDQLSGGQQQRVALARALARRPRVLLLDEPLAALDRKLREETRFELMELRSRLGATFIIVTHDRDEAMVMADRIAVMDRGRIAQVGTPAQIYEAPNSRQVAAFLGDVNLFETRVESVADGMVWLRSVEAAGGLSAPAISGLQPGQSVWLMVRPEKLEMSHEGGAAAPNSFAGVVREVGYLGDWTTYVVETAPGRRLRAVRANASSRTGRAPARGDPVRLNFAADAGVVLTR
jgi:putrescine transport system ATP-binding protein